MIEELGDEAFDRLRAADPAVGLDPDPAVLLAAARVRAGLDLAGPGRAGGGRADLGPAQSDASGLDRPVVLPAPGEPDPDDDLAVARAAAARRASRAHRRRWQVAAVVAGVLVVGGGGYGLGLVHQRSGQTGSADSAAGVAQVPGARAEQLDGPTTFEADGLSQVGGSAHVYDLRTPSPAQPPVAGYAAAWGVHGPVTTTADGAAVASGADGSVIVQVRDGLDLVSLQVPGRAPCTAGPGCATAAAPSRATAVDQTLALLRAAGVDVGTLAAATAVDGAVVTVDLSSRLDGLSSPLGWRARVSAAGVFALDGAVGAPSAGPVYDVISPAQAVQRLDDPRFGADWGAPMTGADGRLPDLSTASSGGPVPAASPAAASDGPAVAPSDAVPLAPASTGRTVAPLAAGAPSAGASPGSIGGSSAGAPVLIVSARLALALDGARLVPAYELTDGQGRTYRVPALSDEALEVLGG